MRRTLIFLFAAVFCLSAGTGVADQKKKHTKKKKAAPAADESNAPDKVLYGRALGDIKHGRHEVGRLTLQTLINTYPDSEYLAKSKLGMADSYFKEGGSGNLAQAIASYKDFIVFFPFLPEAAYSQMQVGMAHYKQLEKPDRDRSHARAAEDEFQTFLQKYPNDPLIPQAEQRLREVQEILAEGDYRIGYYYYVKGSYRASAGRLLTLTRRYPLYSRSDRALWMLANIFEKGERKDLSAGFYARIVKDYPLSGLTGDAKKKLTALGAPIPQPDPVQLAWMQKEHLANRGGVSLMHKATGILTTRPDLRAAARHGKPNLEPESEAAGTDILTPGGQTTIGGAAGSGNVTAPVVEVVTPGVTSDATNGTASGATQEGTPPAGGDSSSANPPAATENGPGAPPSASDSSTGAGTSTPATAEGGAATATSDAAAPKPTTADGSAAQAADASKPTDGTAKPDDKKKESSSKKKKGLRKIIPW